MLIRDRLYFLGCAVMVISSYEPVLNARLGIPGLAVAMVLVGLGGGGFKMIMVPFIGLFLHRTHSQR